jgi:hypothetical protein
MEAGSKWMGGSSLEPPIGVAVKGAFYDVRYPGIVIHPSVVWFVGLKFQRITIQLTHSPNATTGDYLKQ